MHLKVAKADLTSYCVEGVVKVDSLVDGEECWISNGVRGFLPGIVKFS